MKQIIKDVVNSKEGEYYEYHKTCETLYMKNKIENIFKSYPDIKVSEFKFLIDDLVELYAQGEANLARGILRRIEKGRDLKYIKQLCEIIAKI